MARTISQSVGKGGVNRPADVKTVQELLNDHLDKMPSVRRLNPDSSIGPQTINAIQEFQRRVVKMTHPDGRVDPGGATLAALNGPASAAPVKPAPVTGVFSHPDADKVKLTYGIQGDGKQVVQLNSKAEQLLKSILASCGMMAATLTSTLRTYHDQARITITQTYKADPAKVSQWYGAQVLEACKKYLDDIAAFATWWEEYDRKRGKVSSLHLSNRAMDVVPSGDRTKFAAKVAELVPLAGTGVKRIIPKGVMGEPVDHVEFTFDVT